MKKKKRKQIKEWFVWAKATQVHTNKKKENSKKACRRKLNFEE